MTGRLFARLTNRGELEKAWLQVLAHYKKDSLPLELREFDKHRGRELDRIASALTSHTFLPEPASLIYIPKPGRPGETRPIGLVSPDDRIVLTALKTVLEPLFERQFASHSYAYRAGRGALLAIARVEKCLGNGLNWTASADIDDFFASIDRSRLLNLLKRSIWEQPVLDLLEIYLHIGAVRNLDWVASDRGVAQGSPLSPLLSNVYLMAFDRDLDATGLEWVRYADNFLLLSQDKELATSALDRAERFLLDQCGLRLNAGSRIVASDVEGFEFLGFRFHDGTRSMSPSKLDQKRTAIAAALRASPNDLEPLVETLSESAKGWRVYYGSCSGARPQLLLLQQHLFDLLVPWLERYRTSGPGRGTPVADLKALLMRLELPSETDARRKLQWVELLLSRSKPKASGSISPVARRAVERRKREYKKKREDLAEIIVSRPGTYLGRTGERLLIRNDGKREAEIPLSLVRSVTLLTSACSLSGELMAAAAARGISIHLLSHDGKPAVWIGQPVAPTHTLSLAQSRFADSLAGLELARIIVAGKIRNQINLLRYYSKYADRRGGVKYLPDMVKSIGEMETAEQSVRERTFSSDLDLERNRLFAAEGQAASSYWTAVKSLLWRKPGFEGRVRRGAGDLVNSLLNYGYGILYSRSMTVLVRAGLNPAVGFLHKPQPGKSALLYDFVEEFRAAAVDRVVFSQLNLGKPYEIGEAGLSVKTKQDLAREVTRRLQADTRYRGETLPLEKILDCQARLLVGHLEGKQDYETFVLPW